MRMKLFAFFLFQLALIACAGCGSQSPPGMQPNTPQPVTPGSGAIQVHAYPSQAVTPMEGNQTIYVIVQDQSLSPIASAQITMEVLMPNGEKALYIVSPVTDAHGMTQYTFPFSSQEVGLVQVAVKATYSGQESKTKTSFRIWW